MATGLSLLLVTPNLRERDRLTRLLESDGMVREVQWRATLAEISTGGVLHQIDVIVLDSRLDADDWQRQVQCLSDGRFRSSPLVVITGDATSERAQDALGMMDGDWLTSSDLDQRTLARSIRYATERRSATVQLDSVRQRLEMLANIDPLTRCLNRRGLEHAARTFCMAAATDDGLPSFALLTDLDNFKRINDNFGHAAGDVLLQEVANVIRHYLRPSDILARVGGDEFLVLLRCLSREEATNVAERLRMALDEAYIEYEGSFVRVTASVGIAAVSSEGASVSELLHSTHLGLKRCKRRGKNQQAWSTLEQPDSLRLTPEDQVMLTMSRGEGIQVVCQPIVDLETSITQSVELLTRGPNGAFESPNDFFRIAQERQLVNTIDMKCLEACVRAMHPNAAYHVNLLPSTILSVGGNRLARLFESAGAREICLEISEKQIVANPRYLIEHLNVIREVGVKVAIDDVGFGRSCMESLIVLSPDTIKIDRAWVSGVDTKPLQAHWLMRLHDVAGAVNANVVAEGVETRGERDWLVAQGLDLAQGYLWGRPAAPSRYIDEQGEFIRLDQVAPQPNLRREPRGMDAISTKTIHSNKSM